MEQLVEVLQDISKKLDGIPSWITITGVFVPIVLSFAVFLVQIMHQKSNKELQKRIHNHEVELKCFDSFLMIYDVYSKSVDSLPARIENIRLFLKDESTKTEWYYSLVDTVREMYRKLDFAILLLGTEDKLIEVLKLKIDKYDRIISQINELETPTEEDIEHLKGMIEEYRDAMNYEQFDEYFSRFLSITHYLE